jgi:hypothetical protein
MYIDEHTLRPVYLCGPDARELGYKVTDYKKILLAVALLWLGGCVSMPHDESQDACCIADTESP